MMKTRILTACILAIIAALPAAAQIDPSKIGKDQAQQQLVEVSVSKLEDAAFWHGAMSLDDGIVTLRSLPGSPAAKKPAEGDVLNRINEQDTRVLGVKVDFYHRGVVQFTVHPTAPIPIAGISKTISVWIAGRNFNHTLKILIDDYFGRPMELTVGKLNFMGWKKLTVAVPPSHHADGLPLHLQGRDQDHRLQDRVRPARGHGHLLPLLRRHPRGDRPVRRGQPRLGRHDRRLVRSLRERQASPRPSEGFFLSGPHGRLAA